MNKATLIGIGVLLVGLCTAAPAKAQYCYVLPLPQAPDACNGGYYAQNVNGAWYGPNYYVYPPYPPFNGMVPGPPNCSAPARRAGAGFPLAVRRPSRGIPLRAARAISSCTRQSKAVNRQDAKSTKEDQEKRRIVLYLFLVFLGSSSVLAVQFFDPPPQFVRDRHFLPALIVKRHDPTLHPLSPRHRGGRR